MGSQFHTAEFDGKLTRSELIKQYNLLVEEERYEHGSGAYSGTFATLHGVEVLEKTFGSEREASDHVENNTSKWGSALAVKYRDQREVITSSPTFNGKKFNSTGPRRSPGGTRRGFSDPPDSRTILAIDMD